MNCNVIQCRYNKDNKCINDNTSISFDWDSNEAICITYKEKIELIKNNYHIIKLPENYFKADYMVIMQSFNTAFDYWNYIEKDINKINKQNPIKIILDHTLHNGIKNHARFILMNYDKNKIQYSCKIFNATENSPIRKISCNYFKSHSKAINCGILSSTQKNMILKGIIL